MMLLRRRRRKRYCMTRESCSSAVTKRHTAELRLLFL